MNIRNRKIQRAISTRSELISSLNNPTVKAIRSLARRQARDSTGLFFVEGLHVVAEAVTLGAEIEMLVVAPELLTSEFGWELAQRHRQGGGHLLEVTPTVFASLSQREGPQGIGAVLHQRWDSLDEITLNDGRLWVALDTVQYPGNLGTILRTCDAVGGKGIILLGNTTDPYDPAAVRASTGAVLSQRLVRTTCTAFAEWKRRHNVPLVGTSPSASTDYRTITYPTPLVLCMGSERAGLSAAQQALCDTMVRIPMVGRSDSLNLAVATSVMLYEIFHATVAHDGREAVGFRSSRPPPTSEK